MLLIIPLVIYVTELVFWFMMMKSNKFPADYNSWRAAILVTLVWLIVFAFYLIKTSDKLPTLLMTLFSPLASYIVVTTVITLASFITWNVKPFINSNFETFWLCFTFSYIIPCFILSIRRFISSLNWG